jgi:hypothetical protein
MWQSGNRWWWVVIVAAGAALGALIYYFDFFSLLALVASSSTQEKLAVYQEDQTVQGTFQVLYSAYLVFLAFYLHLYSKDVAPGDVFAVRYAIVALLATAAATVALAGTYAFYSRTYAIACLFQGLASALVFSASKRNPLHHVVFVVTLVAAAISYFRLLTFYADEYTPYRLVLETF